MTMLFHFKFNILFGFKFMIIHDDVISKYPEDRDSVLVPLIISMALTRYSKWTFTNERLYLTPKPASFAFVNWSSSDHCLPEELGWYFWFAWLFEDDVEEKVTRSQIFKFGLAFSLKAWLKFSWTIIFLKQKVKIHD